MTQKPNKRQAKSTHWRNYAKLLSFVWICGISLPAFCESILDIHTDIKEISSYQVFDHIETGFSLTGNHEQLDCKSCHRGGRIEKLPRRCDACHNNEFAPGLPNGHVISVAPCDICHTTLGFIEQIDMDHRGTKARCVDCHNGLTQIGKTSEHIAATDECGECHNTMAWMPVGLVDHQQIRPGSCINCHNNLIAKGKNPVSHINSSNECEACHGTVRGIWRVERLDHTHTRGACETCHNQLIASGPDRRHQLAAVSCDSCHNVVDWHTVFYDHLGLMTQSCKVCHNGELTSGKPVTHVVSSDLCESCHTAGISWQVSSGFTHSGFANDEGGGMCQQCHEAGAAHLVVTEPCSRCHVVEAWSILTIHHSDVVSMLCESCHDNIITQGKSPGHCATNNRCERCHTTQSWHTEGKCAGSDLRSDERPDDRPLRNDDKRHGDDQRRRIE